jgi:polyhydroxybutyrate depolymerase
MRIRGFVFGILLLGQLAHHGYAQRPRLARGEASGLETVSWKVGGVGREALVYEPSPRGAKRPLILAFHGHGGKAAFASRKFAFETIWPEAVCVYPQGLPTAVPVIDEKGRFPGWQKAIGDQGDRDLAFFDAMLKTMIDDYQVDERRVYVAGHSNGAYFTYLLCAARADRLAAVSPIAGAINPRDAREQKPLPILHVAGESDRLVRFPVQERSIMFARAVNGCEAEGRPAGKWCLEYPSPNGTPVVAYIHPGGHEIPDEAPARIVEFFKEHSRQD